MKELNIPTEISIRIYTDNERPKGIASGNNFSDELDILSTNGSKILSAAIMIEDRMIESVSKLLFGKTAAMSSNREFFVNEIMGTSDFSYAFKRRVFTRLLEQLEAVEAQKIKELKAALNNIMLWRNAFAHGKVLHEINGGFILQYYSGGRKEIVLNNNFFENVESTFRECLYICNGIIQAD